MENKRVSVLVEAGLKRLEAKALLFLFEHNEVVSRFIERNTELRQPEVSNAMANFSKRGWISRKQNVKTGGKGRPETIFTLSKKKVDIIKSLKEQLRQDGIQIKKTLEKLDKLFQEE